MSGNKFNVGDIVKFESMEVYGLVIGLRSHLIIVVWFDEEVEEPYSYTARDLIKVSDV